MIKATLENIFDWLSPVMRGMRLLPVSGSPIFMFHRVLPEGETCYASEMITSTKLFQAFLDWVGNHYRVVAMKDLAISHEKLRNGKKPPCAITFDDGWCDVFVHAFPALRERKMAATVFLPVRFVGTTRRFWQDRLWSLLHAPGDRANLATKLGCAALHFPWCPPLGDEILDFNSLKSLLRRRSSFEATEFVDRIEEAVGAQKPTSERAFVNWDEVRTMQSAGISFGSHTLNHTLLTHTEPQKALREVEESRHELQDALGSPVAGFSYPWGATNAWIREGVKNAGYEFAVTTQTSLVRSEINPFLFPRLALSSAFMRGPENQFAPKRLSFYIARTALRQGPTRASTAGMPSPRRRLRIAFVIDCIDSWEGGGTEKQLQKLIGALDRRYFEPELCFLRPSSGLGPGDFPCPVHVATRKHSRLPILWGLVRVLRERHPDLVQCFFRDGILYGTVAAFLARTPRIVSGIRNAGHWISKGDRLALGVINRLTDAWQCNSRTAFEFLRTVEGLPQDRIEILPNGLDLSGYAPPTNEERLAARRCLGLPEASPVFISVANLFLVKDPQTLVEAAASVHKSLPDAQFLLVGEGPLRDSLTARIRQTGLADAVRLVGAQSDLRPYLMAADVGLLTSRSESSSNSVLEYMAMGLPAVLSDIPANRELVEGVFFKTGDAADLAKKILDLWSNAELRRQLGQEYGRRVAQFSLDHLARRAQGYYMKWTSEESEY